jgi:hypothetical protein
MLVLVLGVVAATVACFCGMHSTSPIDRRAAAPPVGRLAGN